MPASRNRLSRFLADSRPQCDPVFHSVSNFYREEFVKCQRCLEQQREYLLRRRHYRRRASPHQGDVTARSALHQSRRRSSRQPPSQTVRRRHRPFGLVRSPTHSLTLSVQHLRNELREILHAAVQAADAGRLVRDALRDPALAAQLNSAAAYRRALPWEKRPGRC